MKRTISLSIVAVMASFIMSSLSSAQESKWTRLVAESGNVLYEIQQMPDKSVPRDLLERARGIAIFPSTVSAGFGIGGKYGQGVILARDPVTGRWSPPAVFTLIGGSVGWQIGGQATDIVLLIMSGRSVEGLLSSKFKLGADAAVAAGPLGRDAEAAVDAQLKGGILSYSRSRGLFIGVKLEGAALNQHRDANALLYGGDEVSAREILIERKVKMPRSADTLLTVLNKYPFSDR
ncbi:MAG: lipid-binding SYLF domain-containing protein [Candidatus Omnitrophota bacterium]